MVYLNWIACPETPPLPGASPPRLPASRSLATEASYLPCR